MKTKTGKEGTGLKIWKRNAVVVAIVLFVCVAVYLNWSYQQDGGSSSEAGKTLGQAALVGGQPNDPLLRRMGRAAAPVGRPAPDISTLHA